MQKALMNSLYEGFICVACLAILATAPIPSAQDKLERVWKLTEVTFTTPNDRTVAPAEPGI
jgi:hypothetical protein